MKKNNVNETFVFKFFHTAKPTFKFKLPVCYTVYVSRALGQVTIQGHIWDVSDQFKARWMDTTGTGNFGRFPQAFLTTADTYQYTAKLHQYILSVHHSRLSCHLEGKVLRLDVRGSVHHSTIHKEKSNKMQQCIKILFLPIYIKLNMFWETHRPSSGA